MEKIKSSHVRVGLSVIFVAAIAAVSVRKYVTAAHSAVPQNIETAVRRDSSSATPSSPVYIDVDVETASVPAASTKRTAKAKPLPTIKTATIPKIDLVKIIGCRIDQQAVVRDYVGYWQPKLASLSKSKRSALVRDPSYVMSYLAFYLDDIARLQASKKSGTVSLCLAQSYREGLFGTSDLGRSGNHFGIKGKLKFGQGTRKQKDDLPWQSTFGKSGYAGWASFEQYFSTVKNIAGDRVHSKYNPYKGQAEYKQWAWALQHPYTICPSCSGYGCRRCGQAGMINTRVYATMKFPRKKPNPDLYTKSVIDLIEKRGWDVFDRMSVQQIVDFTEKLKAINKNLRK